MNEKTSDLIERSFLEPTSLAPFVLASTLSAVGWTMGNVRRPHRRPRFLPRGVELYAPREPPMTFVIVSPGRASFHELTMTTYPPVKLYWGTPNSSKVGNLPGIQNASEDSDACPKIQTPISNHRMPGMDQTVQPEPSDDAPKSPITVNVLSPSQKCVSDRPRAYTTDARMPQSRTRSPLFQHSLSLPYWYERRQGTTLPSHHRHSVPQEVHQIVRFCEHVSVLKC